MNCGHDGGILNMAFCMSDHNEELPDEYCWAHPKPTETWEACYIPCPYWVSTYSDCTQKCQGEQQLTEAHCYLNDDVQDDSICLDMGIPVPDQIVRCGDECEIKWMPVVVERAECMQIQPDVQCGVAESGSLEQRWACGNVNGELLDDEFCSEYPHETRVPSPAPCAWRCIGDWSVIEPEDAECVFDDVDATCGIGILASSIICLASDGSVIEDVNCDINTKPLPSHVECIIDCVEELWGDCPLEKRCISGDTITPEALVCCDSLSSCVPYVNPEQGGHCMRDQDGLDIPIDGRGCDTGYALGTDGECHQIPQFDNEKCYLDQFNNVVCDLTDGEFIKPGDSKPEEVIEEKVSIWNYVLASVVVGVVLVPLVVGCIVKKK
eukprot:TRINITY_DN1254_c0_g2_i1.p1 TRINITY_DN1254_c0_g2~~TRINITY_DN1254_c0_g2_i1.p1  ORF type:complete len:406 (+),score=124.59 TRINITY_DN1254_c0_g2_i1:80-1219(+)